MKDLSSLFKAAPRAWLVGAALAFGLITAASAMPITKQLVVNVITVCDENGANCASNGPSGNSFFEAEADKIWAQAGIDISFISGPSLLSATLWNGATGIADFTSAMSGPGTTMWLVDSLVCGACTLYGEAWSGFGGLVIDMSAVLDFSVSGRLDTIAHELGHNLGLYEEPDHDNGHDNSNANFLIASGSVRNVPGSLGEICPDPSAGSCRDLLSSEHITIARDSSLLVDFTPGGNVPEPGSLALVAAGLFAAGMVRRRRS